MQGHNYSLNKMLFVSLKTQWIQFHYSQKTKHRFSSYTSNCLLFVNFMNMQQQKRAEELS